MRHIKIYAEDDQRNPIPLIVADDGSLQTVNAAIAGADDLIPVTKSDDTDDPAGPFRGLLLATTGILKARMATGQDRDFADGELIAGVIHPMNVLRVWNTGTGSQGIKGAI
jgi:hypothetical protein